jgi:hypothetical protein
MADVKKSVAQEVIERVEAAKQKSDNSVKVTVFVPKGAVREGDIKKTALLAAEDKIPIAAIGIEVTIQDASDIKSVEGREGREYEVLITYTPRRTTAPAPDDEKGTVGQVLESLEPLTPEKLAEATTGGSEE